MSGPDEGGGVDNGVGNEADNDEVIKVRRGLFGGSGSGDTSGYGRIVREATLPGDSPRPYGGYFDEVVDGLAAACGRSDVEFAAAVEKVVVFRGELTIFVARESLPAIARLLRDEPDLRFELSLGVSGVHYPEDTDRELHAVYPLRSITHHRRVCLEVAAPDSDPHIPSLYGVYPTTDWHGHPQRKDYPLGGIPVEYKGAQIPPPDQRRAYT